MDMSSQDPMFPKLQIALKRLRAEERRVLEMTYFDGLAQQEIARQLGASQPDISRLVQAGLTHLRQLLKMA